MVRESKKTFSSQYVQARPFVTFHHRESRPRRHENQCQDLILTVFVLLLFDILLVMQTLTSQYPNVNVFTQERWWTYVFVHDLKCLLSVKLLRNWLRQFPGNCTFYISTELTCEYDIFSMNFHLTITVL